VCFPSFVETVSPAVTSDVCPLSGWCCAKRHGRDERLGSRAYLGQDTERSVRGAERKYRTQRSSHPICQSPIPFSKGSENPIPTC
jgi:hypothetical protein